MRIDPCSPGWQSGAPAAAQCVHSYSIRTNSGSVPRVHLHLQYPQVNKEVGLRSACDLPTERPTLPGCSRLEPHPPTPHRPLDCCKRGTRWIQREAVHSLPPTLAVGKNRVVRLPCICPFALAQIDMTRPRKTSTHAAGRTASRSGGDTAELSPTGPMLSALNRLELACSLSQLYIWGTVYSIRKKTHSRAFRARF